MRSLAQQYFVAKYLRLSKEDGKAESQSIQTHREMLNKYINEFQTYSAIREANND